MRSTVHFAADCGSPVLLVNDVDADVRVLYTSSLDDPGWYQQRMDIYTDSAQPWDLLHSDTMKVAGVPERRGKWHRLMHMRLSASVSKVMCEWPLMSVSRRIQ